MSPRKIKGGEDNSRRDRAKSGPDTSKDRKGTSRQSRTGPQNLTHVASQADTERRQNGKADAETSRLAQELTDRLNELRTLMDNAQVAIWIARDPSCLTITGNAYANRLFGVTNGQNVSGSAAPSNAAVRYQAFRGDTRLTPEELPAQAAAATGKPVNASEIELVFEDGRRLSMIIGAVPLLNGEGNVRGAVAFGTDITERRHDERKIRELMASVQNERDRLSSLLESIPDEVWFADARGTFTLANPAALRQFGLFSPGIDVEALARSVEVLRPDGTPRPASEAPPLRALNGETIRDQEEIVRMPVSGELRARQVNAAPVMDHTGAVIGSVSLVRDITDTKKASRALEESERRYRSLFDNLMDGYAYCRMEFEDGQPIDFVYLAVNKSFERLTGLVNVAGKRVTEVIPGIRDSNPELFELYGRVASTAQPERFETYLDPLKAWFSVSAYSTEPGTFVAVFENITEHNREKEGRGQAS